MPGIEKRFEQCSLLLVFGEGNDAATSNRLGLALGSFRSVGHTAMVRTCLRKDLHLQSIKDVCVAYNTHNVFTIKNRRSSYASLVHQPGAVL